VYQRIRVTSHGMVPILKAKKRVCVKEHHILVEDRMLYGCLGCAGRAMAELIVDGESSVDLAPFSPQRFMPRATTRGRKKTGTSVGEQW
jgi:hypothetical protein